MGNKVRRALQIESGVMLPVKNWTCKVEGSENPAIVKRIQDPMSMMN